MLKSLNFRRTYFKVLLLLIILCGLIPYYIKTKYLPNEIEIAKRCYLHNGRNPNGTGKALTYFEDLLSATKKPKHDQGIFFVETKCSNSGIVDIKPRFACSIESAAKGNPSRDAFVIFSSPVGLPRHEEDWPPAIKALMEYPNIHFRNVQLQRLCANTPLENWIKTSKLFNSRARYEHASDIIRALTVYRYGGTYLDLDFMMVRRLDSIKRDWIAIQNGYWLNGAVFDFRRSGIGHIVMNEVLSDLAENYRPQSWGYNGPFSFQRVLRNICNEVDLSEVERKHCRGAKIHPAEMFYPLYGRESLKFFYPNSTEEVLNKTTKMMGFHFYNSASKKIDKITMRQGSAYDLFAKEHCPLIYAEHEEF